MTSPVAYCLMEERSLHRVQKIVCNMSNQEMQNAIDEALAILEMGLLQDKALENLKKGASLLAHVLLRRKTQKTS